MFKLVLISGSYYLMGMSLRAHLLFPLLVQCYSITNVHNLGHWEPGILPFLCRTVVFGCHFYPISFKFFNPFTMTEESRLLEWYVLLEDQCFMDQLHQSVSILSIPIP